MSQPARSALILLLSGFSLFVYLLLHRTEIGSVLSWLGG